MPIDNNDTGLILNTIDIGANLTNKAFNHDLPQVLKRAQQAGVERLIITGTNIAESTRAADLALQYPLTLNSTAGIHPHYAEQINNDSISILRTLAARPEVRAIGECGLDFNRNFSEKKYQINAFEQQIELAIDMQLPLFLHERDAFKTQIQILSSYRNNLPKVVIHCFTGSKKEAFSYLDIDCYIGITGWICDEKRGHHLHKFIGDIPLNRLMIETDSPYLVAKVTPKPKLAKSGRNEPWTLPLVLNTIAINSSSSIESIAANTTANAVKFFNLTKQVLK